jgi:mono/diheme cytochrome c family protein
MSNSPLRRWALLLLPAALPALAAPSARAAMARGGDEIYRAACQSCHGADGRGAPASAVGFALPLPDFTDCSFSTREPAHDWGTVVREGGPARAFDRLMPAFGGALDDREIAAVVRYVRSFCGEYRDWPPGDLNPPRAQLTEKAFVEDEVVLAVSGVAGSPGAVKSKLVYEQRFGARNQFEVIIPFTALESDAGGWRAGIGDVAVGAKRVFWHRRGWGSIFSAAGEVVLPSGDDARGLGKGVTVFEPFLAYGQILPARSFLHLQVGAEIPVDQDAGENEAFFRAALGKTFAQGRGGRAWSPIVELAGARELEGGVPTVWDVAPQLIVSLSTRQHLLLSLGGRFPVNHRDGRDPEVLCFLLWDWFDGGLFEGW